jgi:hypothetical protein
MRTPDDPAFNEQDDATDAAEILSGLCHMGADIHNGLATFEGLLDVAGDAVPPTPPNARTVTFLVDHVRQ